MNFIIDIYPEIPANSGSTRFSTTFSRLPCLKCRMWESQIMAGKSRKASQTFVLPYIQNAKIGGHPERYTRPSLHSCLFAFPASSMAQSSYKTGSRTSALSSTFLPFSFSLSSFPVLFASAFEPPHSHVSNLLETPEGRYVTGNERSVSHRLTRAAVTHVWNVVTLPSVLWSLLLLARQSHRKYQDVVKPSAVVNSVL